MKLNLGFYLAVLPQFGYWRGFLMMKSIGQPVPESVAVSSTEEALEFSRSQKFPLIVRPDFTLGGTGGGIAWNEEELKERIKEGLQASPVHRVLVENYLFCPSIEVDLSDV